MEVVYAERNRRGIAGVSSESVRIVRHIEIAILLQHIIEVHSGYAGNYKIKNIDDAPVNFDYLKGLHDGCHRKVGTTISEHPL